MLKKSLIAIAVLAIAMPAFAADPVKEHKPWSSETATIYHYKNMATIDVLMDVGYWIQLQYAGSIKVSQTDQIDGQNPYYTYYGCLGKFTWWAQNGLFVKSNFLATLKGTAEAKSAAEGKWSVDLNGDGATTDVGIGESYVSVCVTGKEVKIEKLPQADNVKVAEVTIWVIPTEYKNQTEWPN